MRAPPPSTMQALPSGAPAAARGGDSDSRHHPSRPRATPIYLLWKICEEKVDKIQYLRMYQRWNLREFDQTDPNAVREGHDFQYYRVPVPPRGIMEVPGLLAVTATVLETVLLEMQSYTVASSVLRAKKQRVNFIMYVRQSSSAQHPRTAYDVCSSTCTRPRRKRRKKTSFFWRMQNEVVRYVFLSMEAHTTAGTLQTCCMEDRYSTRLNTSSHQWSLYYTPLHVEIECSHTVGILRCTPFPSFYSAYKICLESIS